MNVGPERRSCARRWWLPMFCAQLPWYARVAARECWRTVWAGVCACCAAYLRQGTREIGDGRGGAAEGGTCAARPLTDPTPTASSWRSPADPAAGLSAPFAVRHPPDSAQRTITDPHPCPQT